MVTYAPPIPKAFEWRRMHSLTGLWLVLFLIVHLLTNSQAALWVGDYAPGFIKSVNDIHNLPYLEAIEILFLAFPFFVHMVWGVKYLLTAQANAHTTDGTTPSLGEYPRNHAYSWQRITSWILLVLITLHVIQMRFMDAPVFSQDGTEKYYAVRVEEDAGLQPLAAKLGAQVSSNGGQTTVIAKDFGTAELLMVRETFKSPLMVLLYTVLVLSACFHAFNGFWTFLITWGATLSPRSQRLSRKVANVLMFLITFLGLAAVWGTYLIYLRQ